MKKIELEFDSPNTVDNSVIKYLSSEYNISSINISKKFLDTDSMGLFSNIELLNNIYFIDIETNGIFPFEEIVDITLKKVIIDTDIPGFKTTQEYSFYIEPSEYFPNVKNKFYDGNTLKAQFKKKSVKKEKLIDFFTKLFNNTNIILIGHNVIYDYNILLKNNIIKKYNKNIYLIDTLDFAYLLEQPLKHKCTNLKFSLESLVTCFSNDIYILENSHISETDVDNTIFLFNNLVKTLIKLLNEPLYEYVFKYLTDNFILKLVLNKIIPDSIIKKDNKELTEFDFKSIMPDIETNDIPKTANKKEHYNKEKFKVTDFFPKEFKIRDSQLNYINYYNSFNKSDAQYCFIEAPTGTGKTLAYLSYLYYDFFSGKQTSKYIISTFTKNLQNQIKDSIDIINKSLPSSLRLSYMVLKGKNNYICFLRLFNYFTAKQDSDNIKNITAIFLLLNINFNGEKNEYEVESLIPYYIQSSLGIYTEVLHYFSYNRNFSHCMECAFQDDCPIFTKYYRLKKSPPDIVITNHSLIMLESGKKIINNDNEEEQNNVNNKKQKNINEESGKVQTLPSDKQDENNVSKNQPDDALLKDDDDKSDDIPDSENLAFAPLLKKKFNKIIFDEAHRIVDAYVGVNEKNIGLNDIKFLYGSLKTFYEFIKDIKFKSLQQKDEFILQFNEKKESILKKIDVIFMNYHHTMNNFSNRLKEVILSDINNFGIHPQKNFILNINIDSFSLFSKFYLLFNSDISFFNEPPAFPNVFTFDEIESKAKFFPLFRTIIDHFDKHTEQKNIVSIFDDLYDIFQIIKNITPENIKNISEQSLNNMFAKFATVYAFFQDKSKIFYELSVSNIIDNNISYWLLQEKDVNLIYSNLKELYDIYKKNNMKKQFALIVYTTPIKNTESEEEFLEEEELSKIKLTDYRFDIYNWDFFITDVDVAREIRYQFNMFEKILFTSATLDLYDGEENPFFVKEFGLLDDKIYSASKNKIVIKLPEVFDLRNQLFIAVPFYVSIPKEYFYDEFKYDSTLEIIRILKFFENFKLSNGLKFKVLVLFTSYVMLLYAKYFLRKFQLHLEMFNNFDFLFQRELSKEELIEKFVKINNRIAVALGLHSFGEGFDILSRYAKEISGNTNNAFNPIKILIINKIPFLNMTSLYHSARIKALRFNESVQKILRKHDRNFKIKSVNAAMYSYILPLSSINLKQWVGRLIRSSNDKGIIFLTDRRLLDSKYGEQLRDYIGSDIRVIFYGEQFYQKKNQQIEKYLFSDALAIPHYFIELQSIIFEILDYEFNYDTSIDFSADKLNIIQYEYWNQKDTIKHGKQDWPRFFTVYFHRVFTTLLNKHNNNEHLIDIDIFIDKHLEKYFKSAKLAQEVKKYAAENLKNLFKQRNFNNSVKKFFKVDTDNIKTNGKSFEDEFKKLQKELGKNIWKKYVLHKIFDFANGWNESIVFSDDADRGYISQRDIMAKVFGIDLTKTEEFKKGENIRTDSIFILKTGFGKSLCFQVPALLDKFGDGITLVFAPLRAIMHNQVEDFRQSTSSHLGYIDYIDSDFSAKTEVIRRLKYNDFRTRILYISPLRLAKPEFFNLLLNTKIKRIIIDEMHTLIEWGDDFSPEFNLVPIFIYQYERQNKIKLPVFGFSASIHKTHKQLIYTKFKKTGINFNFHRGTYNREKLKIISVDMSASSLIDSVEKRVEWIRKKLIDTFFNEVKKVDGTTLFEKKKKNPIKKVVIFCQFKGKRNADINKNERVSSFQFGVYYLFEKLSDKQNVINYVEVESKPYDKQKEKQKKMFNDENNFVMKDDKLYKIKTTSKKFFNEFITYFYGSSEDIEEVQKNFERFKNQKKMKVIITTEAFGMGVDLKDIDMIIHFDFPKSVEQYYQQIGRCRGNGEAYFLYSENDYESKVSGNTSHSDKTLIKNILNNNISENTDYQRLYQIYNYIYSYKQKTSNNISNMHIDYFWLQYKQLKQYMALPKNTSFKKFEEKFVKNLPLVYLTNFENKDFSLLGYFYNWNTIVNISVFENIYFTKYSGSIKKLTSDIYRFLPYYLKSKLIKITSINDSDNLYSDVFVPLVEFIVTYILQHIDKIKNSNSNNVVAQYKFSKTFYELFDRLLNVSLKHFKFRNGLDKYPDIPKLLNIFIYDYLIPVFINLDMFTVVFPTDKSNIKIALKCNIDKNKFVSEIHSKKSISDLKKILDPYSDLCRRKQLINYFNEEEAELLPEGKKNCCDVCDRYLTKKLTK